MTTDGYDALQLGFGAKKSARVTRALQGHFKKSGDRSFQFLVEFAVDDPQKYSLGQELTVEMFKVGDRVDVVGTSKGRGFAGTIKRHGFHRGPMTHGCNNIRQPGSIGSSAWPSRVIKGKRLPGHYGHARKTIRNIEIVDIRSQDNMILLKGAIPGPASGLVTINKPKF
jgi:large subunit ribosomal protein L3